MASVGRRAFVAGMAAAVTIRTVAFTEQLGEPEMYGLVGQMNAAPGKRQTLVAILLEGITVMPGCLSYIVATDPKDENAIWITEVWDSQASHAASLSLASVKAAIAKARPMITGFGQQIVTTPVGGHGLKA